MTADIAAAKSALKHLEIDENPVSLRAKSRDFFWYSPVLKARLDHVVGDFAVAPNSEAEVIEILKACYAANVPVTTRGAGTGNYGQAMPLEGGCILHLKNMNRVKEILPGRGTTCRRCSAALRAATQSGSSYWPADAGALRAADGR